MTGHYPAHHFRAGDGRAKPSVSSSCSCGWSAIASNHAHSVSLFEDHHVAKTGRKPPTPPPAPFVRRTA